jgi:NAD(P)-dependent dehydrogenase (short-subunit alcohol dehydrogenase family)
VCKAEYRRLHFFYDSMCEACAELNYQKRFQTASLVGKTALITGARLKIGFQAALMMLRAGARVIVTTRFPRDAAQRFVREADYESFSERLQIHGLDLRHCSSVELFTRYLEQTLDRLDILINNAAQTVRRPPGFYQHLLELELGPLSAVDDRALPLLRDHEACKAVLSGSPRALPALGFGEVTGLTRMAASSAAQGIVRSAALSQIPLSYDEILDSDQLFPKGRVDADLQQVDLRLMNSWRMALPDVPAPEMLEVQLVNSVAPFILCSKLQALMLRVPSRDKHIVNVSAMEGQFSRYTKTDKHPHTNMAKAALNMLTFTSAPGYAEDGIFMNAVDTGWVTDEDPLQHAERKQREADFQPPLDIVDGAARICDPFFAGLNSGEHVFGKFLKDYKAVAW